MKPGCQDFFRHRILADKTEPGIRYSLSFRCMLSTPSSSTSSFRKTLAQSQDHLNTAAVTIGQFNGYQPPPPGFVPLPMPPAPYTTVQTDQKYQKKMTTVIFGTSITSRVDGGRLGMKGRRVVNCSESGARLLEPQFPRRNGKKVPIISEMIDNFYFTNEAAGDVEKVILSCGTNDICYSRKGVRHLLNPMFDVIHKLKCLFPGALIFIQSTLPMRNLYWYTAENFLSFNDILREVSSKMNCFYVDCFYDFLSDDRYDHNRALFWDYLHLNRHGLGILCTWFKAIIRGGGHV